jgi:cellulose synthase/poly-beta-1,6-N-acetylglucosamine synthase-like glycosyltransferase
MSVIREVGGFRHAHQAEDMEMALRMQRHGYEIENAPRARVYTKVPRTIRTLVKQRTRWTTGFLRNVTQEYRDLVGNPKYGVLGLMILPLGFVAVIGGVALFILAIVMTARELVRTYMITSGVPLSYTLTPHFTLDGFYLSITFVTLLSFITAAVAISLIIIGKRVSETPGGLTVGMIGYALVSGFIAPFWLMRSLSDVITNTKRKWR